jgi:hypothetical protein
VTIDSGTKIFLTKTIARLPANTHNLTMNAGTAGTINVQGLSAKQQPSDH